MKKSFLLEGFNVFGKRRNARYGVEEKKVKQNIEDMLECLDIAYVIVNPECYVKEYHK